MTGTPPGIGAMREPKVVLEHGDDMRVQIEGIGKFENGCEDDGWGRLTDLVVGTLINEVYYE